MAVNRQQLEKDGIYQSNSTLPSLISDLEVIAKTIAEAAVRKKNRIKTEAWAMLAGLILTLAGIAFPPLLLVGILAIAGGFAWLIYSLVSGAKLISEGVRLRIAQERIAVVQQDASAKAPFSFRLALLPRPTRLSEERWTGRKNGKQQFSEDSWLSLEGPLVDGTVLTAEIKDLIRKRTFTTARGKRKSKTRTTHLVNIRFAYPRELYGDARRAGQALQNEVKVGPSATLRSVRVTEKAIVMKALVTADANITQTATMLSLGCYRILNLARRAAAHQRGNAK